MRRWGILRFGAWIAWAAAYALVLNAVLASSLLAATPAAAFGDVAVLCVAHPDAADDGAADGRVAHTMHHCKLCLPGLAAALPPPAVGGIPVRVAIAEPQYVAFEARLKTYARLASYSSRAPPADI